MNAQHSQNIAEAPDSHGFKYWAFISYSHRDDKPVHWFGQKWGSWLHRQIESYAIPRKLVGRPSRFGPIPKRLFPVFRDEDELPTSADLSDSIKNALERSQCLIVICSPNAAQSHWVNEEIRLFKKMGRSDRVLAVIVDGEPNASDKQSLGLEECFPPALRFRVTGSGSITDERVEPVAADLRAGGSSKRYAKLKVVAGILGVDFNELNRRDIRRRRRKRISIAAAVGMLVATMAGLLATTEMMANRLTIVQSLLEKERNLPFSRRSGAYSQQEVQVLRRNEERRTRLVERLQTRVDAGAAGMVSLTRAKAELDFTQAEIAWAMGDYREALTKLQNAADHAMHMIAAANAEFEIGIRNYDEIHEYEVLTADIDLALYRLNQVLGEEGPRETAQRNTGP